MSLPLKILFLFIACIFYLPSLASALSPLGTPLCGLLVRNLSLGMEGDDVRALQQFLNTQNATRVAASGPGAPGEETNFFGSRTQAAVVKFQELYAKDVLTPAGLTKGSGFVGAFTRARIATLCTNGGTAGPGQKTDEVPAAVKLPTTTTLTETAKAASEMPLTVMYPSSYTTSPGKKVTVLGTGFQQLDNVVHIGNDFTITNLQPNKNGYLEITLPSTTPKGRQEIWVTNSKGASNRSWIVIADKNARPPKIISISPTSGFQGTVVTVTGEGFMPTGNDIYAGAAPIKGVPSSDGKTLSFTMTISDIGLGAGVDSASLDLEFPVGFYIVNQNGDSNVQVFNFKV